MKYTSLLQTTNYKLRTTSGFTLIEMIVSVALFSVVMLISVSTLVALVHANRKAQALQSVMNNLNISLDGMARSARTGSDYNGSSGCSGNSGGPNDCTDGGTSLSFEPFGKISGVDPPRIYSFQLGRIYRSEGGTPVPITAPEVTIDDMKFYVVGTTPGRPTGDTVQPKAVVVIKGSAAAPGTAAHTTFHIQATIVQRVLDL